jgi:site-specific DNA recombinase
LDQFVWAEIIRLLEDAALIQAEIDRRREVARCADPLRKREEELRREEARLEKSIERLVTAYQEGLVTLPQLRQRMPELRKQAQAIDLELQSLTMAAVDEAKYLQLAESLAGFRTKLRARAETLDVRERQQILRLLVKEVLVSSDTITLRHSIPLPPSSSGSNGPPTPTSGPSGAVPDPGYLLRTRSHHCPLWGADYGLLQDSRVHHSGFQPQPNQPQHVRISDPPLHQLHQNFVVNRVEGHHDTLPIISTSQNALPSRVGITHSKDNRWRSFDKPACLTACSSFSFYRTVVSR